MIVGPQLDKVVGFVSQGVDCKYNSAGKPNLGVTSSLQPLLAETNLFTITFGLHIRKN